MRFAVLFPSIVATILKLPLFVTASLAPRAPFAAGKTLNVLAHPFASLAPLVELVLVAILPYVRWRFTQHLDIRANRVSYAQPRHQSPP